MDSHQPNTRPTDLDWEEASKAPLPNDQPATKSQNTKPQSANNLHSTLKDNDHLMNRLSIALRQTAFMESQLHSLESLNHKLSDKNIFLQDQFLILKEQYQEITKKNSTFKKQIENNSDKIQQFQNTISNLDNQLKTSEEEKTHALHLNRYLNKQLKEILKKNKTIKEENTLLQKNTSEHKASLTTKVNELKDNCNTMDIKLQSVTREKEHSVNLNRHLIQQLKNLSIKNNETDTILKTQQLNIKEGTDLIQF